MPSPGALIIFVKNPELGKVKTRIAKTLGDEKALQIYLALQRHIRNITINMPLVKLLYYGGYIPDKDDWDESIYLKKLQSDGDIGQRMYHALNEALQSFERVVLIGSDIAQISEDIILKAFKKLDDSDVVFGPALDGGYYLIGLKEVKEKLFSNIQWSTNTVLKQSILNARKLELKVSFVDELSDIDYAEDWKKYGWEL